MRALAPGGPRVWPKGRGPTLGAQAHSPLVRDSGRRARTRRFTHCALPWQRPTPGRSNAEPPVRTLQSERLALGSADANGTNRSDGRPAGRHAPMPPSRMAVVVARSRATVRRAEVDPRRRLKPTTTAPLGCSRSVRLRWGTRCTAAVPAALRCTRCDRLHRAVAVLQRGAVGCNRLRCGATGCQALQQVVTRCNRSCTLCCDHAAALRYTRCNRLHRIAVCCKGLCSVATDGPALQQGSLRCNRFCCSLWHTVAAQ